MGVIHIKGVLSIYNSSQDLLEIDKTREDSDLNSPFLLKWDDHFT